MTIAHNHQFPSGNFFKKILFVLCALWLLTVLLGCSSQYAAERLYWQAGREAQKIIQNKGLDKLTKQEYQEIIDAYRKVPDKFPLQRLAAESHFIIARLYALQAQIEEAHKELVTVTQNFSRIPSIASRAQFMIGNLYNLRGDWARAVSEYEKVTDLYPLSRLGLSTPIYIAQQYQRRKDESLAEKSYDRAIRNYEKIISEYSGTSVVPRIMEYLALAYLNQGKWEEAIKVWEKISNEYSQSPEAAKSLLSSGEIYAKQIRDLEKAIKAYEEFVEQYPQSKVINQVKFQIGKLYLDKGDTEKAKETFVNIIKEYPKEKELCANTMYLLAICYEKEGDSAKTVGQLRQLRQDYPNTKLALAVPLFLALHYQQSQAGQEKIEEAFQEAISEYRKVFEEEANKDIAIEAGRLISVCYVQQQRWNEAISVLNTLIERYPDTPEAQVYLFNIANIYQKELAQPEMAMEVYRKLIDSYPNSQLVGLARAQLDSLSKEQKVTEDLGTE